MAKYTFSTACPKDTYTKFADSVTEMTVKVTTFGRIIIQDAADGDPAADATGWMEARPNEGSFQILMTGLEAYYMPHAVDGAVNGMKK